MILFPNDPTQRWDSDGDGYGDNMAGTNGDAFPYDPHQWSDADGDGYGDNHGWGACTVMIIQTWQGRLSVGARAPGF